MNELTKTNASKISTLIMAGIEAWLEAGRLLVETLDAGATLCEIADESGVSKDILSRFEQIGRNSLYPKLLASTSAGARALSSCPYSEQKYYTENTMSVLVIREDDTDVLQVKLDDLTPEQVKQVFNRGRIRDLAGQRAYLEDKLERDRMAKVAEIEDGAGYVLKGRQVVFKKGCAMSKDDLIAILGRMK